MKIRILIAALLISIGLNSQDVLNTYLEKAAQNNPGLKASFYEYMASLEKIPQQGSLPDPQLAFGYFILPVETRNGPQRAVISLRQMFPWFGSLNAKEDVLISRSKANYEQFEEAKSKLFLDVKTTYYEIYFVQQGIRITNDNIRLLESFRYMALVRIKAGKASGVDELRVEMEIADLENKLALLKDKLLVNKVKFNNLLNVDESEEVIVPDNLGVAGLEMGYQQIRDSIYSGNHRLAGLEFMEESFLRQESFANKRSLPEFSLGIDYIFIGESNNAMLSSGDNGRDAFIPKIGISIPLYRKKYKSMVQEAVLMQRSASAEKENAGNILESIYERVYYEYLDADRRLALFSRQKELAGTAMNILETQYTTDGSKFEELLRMERQLLLYSLEYEKAVSDKKAAMAFINYLMGK